MVEFPPTATQLVIEVQATPVRLSEVVRLIGVQLSPPLVDTKASAG